jgi:hypothetical protein
LLNPSASEAASSEAMAENPAQKMKELLELNSAENKGLMTQYTSS